LEIAAITTASLGALTIDLIANTAGFERGMDKAERALQRQEKAADRLAASIDPVTGAMQRLTAQQTKLDELWQKKVIPDGEYKRLSGILAENEKALQSTGNQLGKMGVVMAANGQTAKQYANNLRGIPAQFTDIATSLAAGQAPLTVFLQQGGQLKDMFGGVGPAAKALGGYVVGLINPFTVLAATLGTLGVVFADAEKEISAFNKALFSGSASSGQTASSLSEIASSAAIITGKIGEAKAAVIALASSTGLSETQFRNLALAATAISEFTGKSAGEVAKSLGDLGDNATTAAQKISAQYGLITNAQYEVIKALDAQGKKQEALDVLSATLAENAQSRLKTYRDSLSDLEKDWDGIGTAISNAYSKVRGELFPDTAKQIEILDRIIATRKEGGVTGALSTGLADLAKGLGLADETTEALEQQVALLKQGEISKKASAELDGKAVRDSQALIKADAESMKSAKSSTPKSPAFREDAGQKMLDTLRQQAAALQVQSETGEKLGVQAQALVKFQQEIADIKSKDIQTADQKSLLASEALITAQLKRNVALEQEVEARKRSTEEAAKLQAFQENQSSKLSTAQDGLNSQLAGLGSGEKLRERLKEDLAIRKDYQSELDKLNKQFNTGQISEDLYKQETDILQENLASRLVMQQDYYNQVDEAQGNFFLGASEGWANWAEEAQNYSAQATEFVKGTLDTLSSGLADSFMSILDGTKSVGEAFADLGRTMVKEIVGALVKMAAQWLVYQAVQLLVGSTSSAASIAEAAVTGTAIATAYAPAAALASIATLGGAAIPATAAILSTTAVAEGVALAGMAHDGIDSVPQTGTWLLQKGERVTTAQTSAKLDKTLNDMKTPTGNSSTTVNLIEDASRAGQTQERTGDQGEKMLDVFVADLLGDGKTADAMSRKFGLQGVGR
jgi:lambda family phage tail tape measure protein